jgi:hypothetical protein
MDQGIPYEVVLGPSRPKNRTTVIEGTGQLLYPAIQFEDEAGIGKNQRRWRAQSAKAT